MKKYEVQELLNQEIKIFKERVFTIISAVILGVYSSEIVNGIKTSNYYNVIYLTVAIFLLVFAILLSVFHRRNNLVRVEKEKFTALICLDVEKNPKPIIFDDYPFSIDIHNTWKSVEGKDENLFEKFESQYQTEKGPLIKYKPYLNDQAFSDRIKYQAFSDLVQYTILRNIHEIPKRPNKVQLIYKNKNYLEKLFYSFIDLLSRYNKVNFIFNNIKSVSRHYEKTKKLKELIFFSDGIPLLCLPAQIQNNFFIKTLHESQLKYEKMLFEEGKSISDFGMFSYTPFLFNFPDNISIKFEDSRNSYMKKIILVDNKVGKLTIEFHDRWRHLSQRAFMQTRMKPGNQYRNFEEIFFEITIDVDIKKYSYFPLIGGREKSVDEFFSWAEKLINDLKTYCDWNYYQENITRNTMEELKNKLDLQYWESRIEYYSDFDDTPEGNTQKWLRYLLSPHFERRKYALEKLKEDKDKIPDFQFKQVILRILTLTNHNDDTTRFLAIGALNDFSPYIPNALHKNVVERLINLVNDEEEAVKNQSLKCLGVLYEYILSDDLKKGIQNKIINAYLSKDESFCYLQHSSIIDKVYPNISTNDRNQFEEKYLQKLKNQEGESLGEAFIFYTSVKKHISKERIKEILRESSKLDIAKLEIEYIEEYLIFIAHMSKVIPLESFSEDFEDLIQKHCKIIHSLICSDVREIKELSTKKLSIFSSFISILSETQKDVIYYRLKLFACDEDENIKFSALETISYLADCFLGKEEEIAKMMLENVDPHQTKNYFHYRVADCFKDIMSRIKDESLLQKVLFFQETVEKS